MTDAKITGVEETEDLDQNNDDYDPKELGEDSRKRARDELHETDEERKGAVLALREWCQQQKWLNVPMDFRFLLRFLRVRKFSQLAARRTLEKFFTARHQSPDWFSGMDTTDAVFQELVSTGFYLLVPGVDSQGRKVMFERVGLLDVDALKQKHGKNTIPAIFKATMAICDWLMMDENVQVNGLVVIDDMTDFSTKHHMMLYTLENTKKLLSIYHDGYPCRTKAVHMYNEPPMLDPLMAMIKPFMKEKMRKRIFMHGKKLTSLYKETDMRMFPTEYLPDDYTGPSPGSIQDVIDYMKRELQSPKVRNHLKALSSGKYKVDLSLKSPEPLEQASFRKLNVS